MKAMNQIISMYLLVAGKTLFSFYHFLLKFAVLKAFEPNDNSKKKFICDTCDVVSAVHIM